MARQLNVRSDEAYELAHHLARERCTTVTAVIEEALRVLQRHSGLGKSTAEQNELMADLLALSEKSAAASQPGASSDHRDMYDEWGLPV